MIGLVVSENKCLHNIERCNRGGNDQRLTNLQTINASQNINGIRTEYGQQSHVNIIKEACETPNQILDR